MLRSAHQFLKSPAEKERRDPDQPRPKDAAADRDICKRSAAGVRNAETHGDHFALRYVPAVVQGATRSKPLSGSGGIELRLRSTHHPSTFCQPSCSKAGPVLRKQRLPGNTFL